MCTVLHYSNIPTADHYKQICVSGKLEYFDWGSMRSELNVGEASSHSDNPVIRLI